jgi:hypothetical protein
MITTSSPGYAPYRALRRWRAIAVWSMMLNAGLLMFVWWLCRRVRQ